MKESASAALSYVRARAGALGLEREFLRTRDLHVHIPAGATPKDGPSAGIAIACAIVSALTGIPLRGDVAMTGEITLRGRVLGIGGLKEKAVAAQRNRIAHVILPQENARDLDELPAEVQGGHHVPSRCARWTRCSPSRSRDRRTCASTRPHVADAAVRLVTH